MRTTISLDERLADQVKRKAAAQGLSVSAFIAKTLNDALKRPAPKSARPFRLVTVKGEGLQPGIDLDRSQRHLETTTAVNRRAFHRPLPIGHADLQWLGKPFFWHSFLTISAHIVERSVLAQLIQRALDSLWLAGIDALFRIIVHLAGEAEVGVEADGCEKELAIAIYHGFAVNFQQGGFHLLEISTADAQAIRDAVRFSREFAYARIGLEFDMADARSALEDIARDYMGCKETWKSIIRIAEKGRWAGLAETAADYVVGDIKESVFVKALQRALEPDVKV